MKKFLTSKKGIVLLATSVAAVVAAMGAYAYFTSTGTGTGSATVGTSTPWAVTETAQAGGPLYPNPTIGVGDIQTNTYTVKNNSNGQQFLTNVTIKVANADGSAWTAVPGCSASDFSVGGSPVGTTHTDASQSGNLASGQTVTSTVTVQMIDNNANQDGCKLATPPLYYSAS